MHTSKMVRDWVYSFNDFRHVDGAPTVLIYTFGTYHGPSSKVDASILVGNEAAMISRNAAARLLRTNRANVTRKNPSWVTMDRHSN